MSVFQPGRAGRFDAPAQRFGARSCVRDPKRMRALFPRLAPHLPRILTAMRGLGDEGLLGLLLVAPDAPLTPSTLGVLAQIVVRPFKKEGGGAPREQLFEVDGLRQVQPGGPPVLPGPERVVFGMIGDSFVVGSDRAMARGAAKLDTRPARERGASALRVPVGSLLDPDPGDEVSRAVADVFDELLVSFSATQGQLWLARAPPTSLDASRSPACLSCESAGMTSRLRVERFALTSNNVTYGTLGDELGYWRLFPAPDGWGRVPAWGYARAIASRSPALAEGVPVFGLVPMASYVTLRPMPHRIGFVDAAPHRAELSPIYNQYLPVADEADDTALIMRPLFGTSLVLDLVLTEAGFEGARTVVRTSASSKTCYGLAHLLRGREVETRLG